MTALDLISGSLRLLGVLGVGEQPTANEATDALASLNELLDGWSVESLMIFDKIREVFPLVSNQQTYTMGTGGNFNTSRPQLIENAFVQVSTPYQFELPIKILNKDEFASITVKSTTSTFPIVMYCEDSYPLANINFWPVPTINYNVVLYSWKPLGNFASTSTTVSLPPGYLIAVRYNLAMSLASEYGVIPSQLVADIAMSSRANVQRMNSKPIYLESDAALAPKDGTFNWITGE